MVWVVFRPYALGLYLLKCWSDLETLSWVNLGDGICLIPKFITSGAQLEEISLKWQSIWMWVRHWKCLHLGVHLYDCFCFFGHLYAQTAFCGWLCDFEPSKLGGPLVEFSAWVPTLFNSWDNGRVLFVIQWILYAMETISTFVCVLLKFSTLGEALLRFFALFWNSLRSGEHWCGCFCDFASTYTGKTIGTVA